MENLKPCTKIVLFVTMAIISATSANSVQDRIFERHPLGLWYCNLARVRILADQGDRVIYLSVV